VYNAAISYQSTLTGALTIRTGGTSSSEDRLVIKSTGVAYFTNSLGIGTTDPDKQVEINSSTGACLRLTYNDSNGSATNYTDLAVSSGGDLTITPSGGNATISGTVGINVTANSLYQLYIYNAFTDPSTNTYGIYNVLRPTYTGAETVTENFSGSVSYIYPIINTGHTNGGELKGDYIQLFRNTNAADSDDNGTLTTLIGTRINYGHYNTNASATPQTTTAYGIFISPYYRTGTITNMYDIYLSTETSGGTATNRYGIYQANASNNRFQGNMGIKKTPTVELDVSGTTATTSLNISSSPTVGYVWTCTHGTTGAGSWQSATGGSTYKGTVDGDDGKYNGGATALIDGTGTTGWYYRCIDAGTYDYGNPNGNSITLAIGDDIIYNGSQWQKIPGSGGYTLTVATSDALGGIKIGYSASSATIPLQLDGSYKAYVDLTKAAIENVLTGELSSHTHAYATPTDITVANEASDTTCFPLFVTAATGDLSPKSNANLTFNSSTGVLTAVNFALSSDIRLKENIESAHTTNIDSIDIKSFNFISDQTKRKRYGVIAQDLEKIHPEMIYEDADGMKQVAYIDFLIAKISSLETRLKQLENG